MESSWKPFPERRKAKERVPELPASLAGTVQIPITKTDKEVAWHFSSKDLDHSLWQASGPASRSGSGPASALASALLCQETFMNPKKTSKEPNLIQ